MPGDYAQAHRMRIASGEAKLPKPAEPRGHPLTEDPDITVAPGQGFVKPAAPSTTYPGYRDFRMPSNLSTARRNPESEA